MISTQFLIPDSLGMAFNVPFGTSAESLPAIVTVPGLKGV